MTAPVLYEFPHSHFCEVARWALEYKGIEYRSVCLLPGFHVQKMKRLATDSSVPVLVDGGDVIQGSARIVDYLEQVHPDRPLTPADAGAVEELEGEIAETIGVPLRRLCYYHLLPHADLVRYFFMHRAGRLANLAFRMTYGVLRKKITEIYDCTESGAESAKVELARAIDAFDRRLAERPFLVGDGFSRVDLTFASLLVFLVMPPEYPVNWPRELAGNELAQWFDTFRDSRSCRQVEFLYANYRR